MIQKFNKLINLTVLLIIFWIAFWSLNGLDKFFNGNMEPMIEQGLEKGVLVDQDGQEVYSLYGYEINGLFGSNRNTKTVTFFERIGVPETVSLPLLYFVASLEIIFAFIFAIGLVQYMRRNENYKDYVALAYKLSIALFIAFCSVDILIGERIELWEHTTFMIALIISYYYFQLFSGAIEQDTLTR